MTSDIAHREHEQWSIGVVDIGRARVHLNHSTAGLLHVKLCAAVAQPGGVMRKPHHAVAVDAAQVGRNQRFGDEAGVGGFQTELVETGGGE